ncbi:MAG TPA: hypothetical protein PKL54_14740, partial [Candidatus Hydrogenedentes bacterium]|nr:hypothetical protein [Candidatus Hydrogenedentota bacterium]
MSHASPFGRKSRLFAAALALLLAGGGMSRAAADRAPSVDFEAVCLAVDDLQATQGGKYPVTVEDRAELERARAEVPALREKAASGNKKAAERLARWEALARRALLANPLLDFDTLLLIRRSHNQLGLPQN